MTSWKEQGLRAKAVRNGEIDAPPIGNKNKRPKDVVVQHRRNPEYQGNLLRGEEAKSWKQYRKYRTVEEAQQAITKLARNYGFYEFRIKPEDTE